MLNQWISSGNLRNKHLSDWWALQRCIPRMDKLTIEFLTIVLCTRGLLERHRTLSPLLKDTYYSRNGLLFVRARDVLDFRFLFFFYTYENAIGNKVRNKVTGRDWIASRLPESQECWNSTMPIRREKIKAGNHVVQKMFRHYETFLHNARTSSRCTIILL